MTSPAVVALGIGQCVNWGVLYYAFAVLLLPVEADLGVARWIVAGAFSLALLMAALLAPAVGRWTDRGHGPMVMQAGSFSAAALLALWALVPSLTMLYVVWTGLGLCMAASLYEPAFTIVGRAHRNATDRLRALATVSLFGGLASTVFLPLTAFLVRGLGWRGAVAVLALTLAASTWMTSVFAFRRLGPATLTRARRIAHVSAGKPGETRPRFTVIVLVFSLGSLAGAAFTTNLVPALGERAVSPLGAAMLGALLGIMQLPGRALLMNGMLADSPLRLVGISLGLQGLGLASFAMGPSALVVACGIAVFAIGAGLTTLVRPHFVQTTFGIETAGYVNGQVARSQQLARAAGPIAVAWLATAVGYGAVFALLATIFTALAIAIASQRVLNGSESLGNERSQHDRTSNATISG